MRKDFDKFKKRIWLHLTLSCVAVAAMTGFFAVLAVLLPCRLFGIGIFWPIYLGVALGGIVLGGGVTLLVLKTNDKKIAQRLDEELSLNERVSTALAFTSLEGEMYAAQRADTQSALSALPAKSLSFKHLILTAVCAALALAMIIAIPVVGIAVPPVFASTEQTDDGGHSEPPREVTDWEWHALDDLIEYVQNSKKADEESKAAMLTQLNVLKNVLLDGVSQSSLKSFVESSVTGIRNAVREINDALASDEQKSANTEESEYVIFRLYEIFDLTPDISGDEGDGETDENGSGNSNQNSPGGGTGSGGLNISDLPFFDREQGYVKCGEVRDDYYERALQALQEGLLSDEEWQLIMATYFSDLNDKNE